MVRFLLAIDGSEASGKAVNKVLDLIKAGDNVLVFHAVHIPKSAPSVGEVILSLPFIPVPQPDTASEEFVKLKAEGDALVAGVAKCILESGRIEAASVSTMTKHGDARLLIEEAIAENAIDTVVLGSTGKGALKRMLLGSVSQYIVNHAACSVIIAR